MAQAQPEKTPEVEIKKDGGKELDSTSNSSVSFKFNAQAPEFVPRSHTPTPVSGNYYPYFQYLGGGAGGSDWIYVGDQEPAHLVPNSNAMMPNYSREVITEDLQRKIIKQVEYQFGGMSLLANESLAKHINKDPEGFVPISVIASAKKVKSLISNNHLLAQALRSSTKLVVSNDGKKIRRKHPFTEKDKEELQSRTVVAENLPEDNSHQYLEKIFNVVGSVKTIRICHPQECNASRSKGDFLISNKIHALVEYETPEVAEKAVEKLNDDRNWRKGLRVRVLLRCSPKSVLKSRKSDFDGYLDDEDDGPPFELSEDSSQANNSEAIVDSNAEESSAGTKKGWARGRGKSRPRTQSHIGRGLLSPSTQSSGAIQPEASTKQAMRGPRMPDGTRGFTVGRGKPICTPVLASSPLE
ncbi:hypothetical protein RJ639_042128 [Escallonia herrerae]|uniref:La-related protein 6C n=1 Tax=Escallonia herrerae TaxID=1293975 RepID=A0AA88WHD9_9ASTE|nr:hypothetical protein RJ639_042128 [Escallonia herrerae]